MNHPWNHPLHDSHHYGPSIIFRKPRRGWLSVKRECLGCGIYIVADIPAGRTT